MQQYPVTLNIDNKDSKPFTTVWGEGTAGPVQPRLKCFPGRSSIKYCSCGRHESYANVKLFHVL